MIYAGQSYKGILVKGEAYRLISRGYDHYCLSVGGRPTYVPLWITEKCPEQEAREREEKDEPRNG